MTSHAGRPSPRRNSPPPGGPHELGQNFLVDRRFATVMADILRHAPPYPVVELGAGTGAITDALVRAGLPVTAVEIDPRRVRRLRTAFAGRARIEAGDMLRYDHGDTAHHVVSNVPFGITTPLLRRLLAQRHWDTAVLLVQWEVARKRAGVGGTTLLTATWWPWYEFALDRRVPAAAFRPAPAVDGGILVIRRRARPLVGDADRRGYQDLVRDVFTGQGRGLGQTLRRHLPHRAVDAWLREAELRADALPRDLSAADWASLHRLHRRTAGRADRGPNPPRRGRISGRPSTHDP